MEEKRGSSFPDAVDKTILLICGLGILMSFSIMMVRETSKPHVSARLHALKVEKISYIDWEKQGKHIVDMIGNGYENATPEFIFSALQQEIFDRSRNVPFSERKGEYLAMYGTRLSHMTSEELAEAYEKAEKVVLVNAKVLRASSEEFSTPGDLERDLEAAKIAVVSLLAEDVERELRTKKSKKEIHEYISSLIEKLQRTEKFVEENTDWK